MAEIKIGQVWQEVDPHFPNLPHKTVVGFDDGKVIISTSGLFNRTTKAKPERFNGKRGGYRLIKDVESGQ